MCSGKDILQVVGVVAAIYTGGAAAGLWGAAEGLGAGAIAGSEAFASGVGAAGGDAVGSLIASNAANWGISVAPEIAALGGSAAELAAIHQISAGTSVGGGLQAAQVPVGEAGAAKSGSGIMGALKAGAQLAPLANLATMLGANPAMESQGSPQPMKQAAQTPAPNIFKKKMQGLGDPTKTSGVGGVSDISLGKATILGS
jgi:hypothetical protein